MQRRATYETRSNAMPPAPPPHELVDDVLGEILLRLPPDSVLRSRAVCKRWRRVTTCPAFLAAYSHRRPPEILAYPDGYKTRGTGEHNVLAAVDPLKSADYVAGCRRFLRFDGLVRLVDSRHGVLLFSASAGAPLLICNPATRQWVGLRLPRRLTSDPPWLYFHRPSGEHRVLCIGSSPYPQQHRFKHGRPQYYILATGAAEPRRLGPVAAGGGDDDADPSSVCLALGDTLHWLYHPESGTSGKMVAFDTVSETFRLIAPPPPPALPGGGQRHLRLFDMDGTLAASAVTAGSRRMDVWVLEDDDGERWTRRLQVDLPGARRGPWPPTDDEAVAVVEGGVLVVVGAGRVVLYDMKEERTVSVVDHRGDIGNVTRFLYRASLVPLPEPDARPLPFCPVGGEPSLRYCPPDDPYMSLFRSYSLTWVVSNAL